MAAEATYRSEVHNGKGDPTLLTKFPVAMMDIEVGSEPNSRNNKEAIHVWARSLIPIFEDDGKQVHQILCVGGVRFEPNFVEAVSTQWGKPDVYSGEPMAGTQSI